MKKKTKIAGGLSATTASVLGLALIAHSRKKERRRRQEEKLRKQMYSSLVKDFHFAVAPPFPSGPRPPSGPPWQPPTRIPDLPEIPEPNLDDTAPIPDGDDFLPPLPNPADMVPDVDPSDDNTKKEPAEYFPEGSSTGDYDEAWRIRMRQIGWKLMTEEEKEKWRLFIETPEGREYLKGLRGPYGERGAPGPPGA